MHFNMLIDIWVLTFQCIYLYLNENTFVCITFKDWINVSLSKRHSGRFESIKSKDITFIGFQSKNKYQLLHKIFSYIIKIMPPGMFPRNIEPTTCSEVA